MSGFNAFGDYDSAGDRALPQRGQLLEPGISKIGPDRCRIRKANNHQAVRVPLAGDHFDLPATNDVFTVMVRHELALCRYSPYAEASMMLMSPIK